MHQRRACQFCEEEKRCTVSNSSVTAWSYQTASVSSCLPASYITWAGHVFGGVKLTFPKACSVKLGFLTCLFHCLLGMQEVNNILSMICPMPTVLSVVSPCRSLSTMCFTCQENVDPVDPLISHYAGNVRQCIYIYHTCLL